MEEGESDEESRCHTKENFGVDVSRSAPILLEHTDSDLYELTGEKHGKFAMRPGVVLSRFLPHFVLDSRKLLLNIFGFVAVLPYIMPVFGRFPIVNTKGSQ